MYFNSYFCFFAWYSYINYEFCNKIKIFYKTAGIKGYKSIIKKKRKKHDKIVLLAKPKLNGIEFLISKALFDSNLSHDEFIFINHVLEKYDDMKKEIKNLKT